MNNMQPHQPNQLVLPEIDYYMACLLPDGKPPVPLSPYDTAMLKMWVVLVAEIAMEKMREE